MRFKELFLVKDEKRFIFFVFDYFKYDYFYSNYKSSVWNRWKLVNCDTASW